MNNKRGGAGAKVILVLILMIASAIGGAYAYRVVDGKMAISDAKKDVEAVRVSDYEAPESTEVQGLIDTVNKDLEAATTRKEVYELMEDFNSDIAKIQTKYQKELEAARKEAEEARNNYNNNNNNKNNNGNNYNDYDDNDSYNDNSNGYNSNNSNSSNNNSGNSSSGSSNGNSNGSGGAITNDDGTSGKGGLLNNLLGNND